MGILIRHSFSVNTIVLCLFVLFATSCRKQPLESIHQLEEVTLKEKNGMSIVGDSTAMLKAYHDFTVSHDRENAMRALFFIGVGQEEIGKNKEALMTYKEAAVIAEDAEDDYWCSYLYSKIGFMYVAGYDVPTGRRYFMKSLEAGRDIPMDSTDISFQLQIGKTLLFCSEPELALTYLLPLQSRVPAADLRYTKIYRNIGIAYFDSDQLDKSIAALNEVLRYERNLDHILVAKMTLMHVYTHKNEKEKVIRYKTEIEEILPQIDNLDLRQQFYALNSCIHAIDGDFLDAFVEMRLSYLCEDDKLESLGKASLDEILLQNYQDKITSENKTLKANYRRAILVSAGIWMATSTAFYLYKRRRTRKLYDLERKIELLEEMAGRSSEESAEFKDMIIRDLEIIKRISLFKSRHSKNESFIDQFNRLVTVDKKNPFELEWQKLYVDVDRLYNNFYSRLTDLTAGLSEKEIQLCCLMKIGFKTDEIAA
ncbi:MAG: hypothetical protein RR346_11885, partial [Bacteroidales bacterium]